MRQLCVTGTYLEYGLVHLPNTESAEDGNCMIDGTEPTQNPLGCHRSSMDRRLALRNVSKTELADQSVLTIGLSENRFLAPPKAATVKQRRAVCVTIWPLSSGGFIERTFPTGALHRFCVNIRFRSGTRS